MPRDIRLVIQRLLLVLVLMAPGTPALMVERAAAQAQMARATQAASSGSGTFMGQPPDDSAQFQSTPTLSGAGPFYPENHSFDSDSQSLGPLGSNADFETAPASVGTPPTNSDLSADPQPVGTPPANSDFEAPVTSVGTPPTNADFETGDFSGWQTGGSPTISSDSSHGYFGQIGSGASLISAPFTMDPSAQAYTFDVKWVTPEPWIHGYRIRVYVLSGTNYGTSTQILDQICDTSCNGQWQTFSFNPSAYVGQSIELKFSQYWGTMGVDNIQMTQFLPDYSFSGNVTRASNGGDTYARVSSGSLITSPFTVDSAAQVATYNLGYVSGAAGYYVYALSGANYGTSTQLTYQSCTSCSGWSPANVTIGAYQGQSIELKFSTTPGATIGVDDIAQETLFPGYAISGDVSRITEGDGNIYANLSGTSFTSPAFIVDSAAQYATVRLRGFGANAQYKVNALSGPDYATVTMITAGYGNQNGWDTIDLGVGDWQGQSIKLQVVNVLGSTGIDDLGLQVDELPGWDVTGYPYWEGDDSGHYVSTNGNLTTQAITLPAGIQQFSLQYRDESNSDFYVEVLHGADFSQVDQLDYLTPTDTVNWTTAKYSLTPYAGQTIKLRIHQWFGRGQYDNVGLGEIAVPGWQFDFGGYAVSVGSDEHGSYVTAYNPGAAMFLTSSTFSTGLIDRPNQVDQKYYAISYAPGGGVGGVTVYWVNSNQDSYEVFSDPAGQAGDYRTAYFWVPDFAGSRGHFVIKDLTGGKIYSIADNVARQQLNEPFSQKVGLQIDTTTGSFGYNETDLTVSGAMPLTQERFYVTQSDQYGTLGYRWSGTYDTHLVLDSDGNAGVAFGSGAEEFFAYNSGYNTFAPADARTHDTLVKEGDGTFTFTTKSNLSYHFDTNATLQTIADLNGNTITLSYDGNGCLSTVTDPAGQSLIYAYDANGRLSTATVGGTLFGIAGAFLALPIAAAVPAIIRAWPDDSTE